MHAFTWRPSRLNSAAAIQQTKEDEIQQVVATMQVDYCDYVVGPMFEQLQAVLGDKVCQSDIDIRRCKTKCLP